MTFKIYKKKQKTGIKTFIFYSFGIKKYERHRRNVFGDRNDSTSTSTQKKKTSSSYQLCSLDYIKRANGESTRDRRGKTREAVRALREKDGRRQAERKSAGV